MKKIAILLVLLAAAGFVYGQATISGEATTEFGATFSGGEVYAGFKVSSSTNISLTVAEAEGSTSSEDEWYGLVELTGASIVWNSDGDQSWDAEIKKDINDDGDYDDTVEGVPETQWINDEDGFKLSLPFAVTAPSIAARITNGTVYIQLQAKPSFSYADEASNTVDNWETDNDEIGDFSNAGDIGISLGYDSDMVNVVFEIVSSKAYNEAPILENSGWGMGLGVDVSVSDDITVAFGVAATMNAEYVYADDMPNNEIGAALGIDAVIAMATIDLGVDGVLDLDAEQTDIEATLAVSLDLAPITIGVFADFTAAITTDVALNDFDTAIQVGVMMDAISLTAGVRLTDIIELEVIADEMDLVFDLDLDYSADIVTAGLVVGLGMPDILGTAGDPELNIVAELGLALLDNTTFNFKFDLAGDDDHSNLVLNGVDDDYGDVTAGVTLTY